MGCLRNYYRDGETFGELFRWTRRNEIAQSERRFDRRRGYDGSRTSGSKVPLLRIRGGFEFPGIERFPFTIKASDGKNEREAVARALEIGDSNAMAAAFQFHRGKAEVGRMKAIVVDDGNVIDEKPGAVVGNQSERVAARLFDPEAAGIVDSETFEAVR